MTRFVFTGGRSYPDAPVVWGFLFGLARVLQGQDWLIAEGGCRTGLDYLVREWHATASRLSHPVPELKTFHADWKAYGIAAGPKRNRFMLDEVKPHIVFAFPGGRGTRDCISAALQRKLRVVEIPELKKVEKCYNV